ncbi:MAG: DPP IV N-terminal domain-containing protein [Elusimicrobiaceae bacterium]|nr:DPP IV N-terminal domain-containing protein [Elusimicrobiaceae bacterium]
MKKLLPLLFLLLPVFLFARDSDVYIGLSSKYNPNSLPKIGLATNTFAENTPEEEKKYTNLFAEVLRSDLYRSRYFNIEETVPAAQISALSPQLSLLEKDGILYFVFFELSDTDTENTLEVKAFMYATDSKKALLAKKFTIPTKSIRKSAHMFADQIIKLLTGKRGLASTKIAFANDHTGRKEIYIVDYDGYNLMKLTSDKSISLLPRWANQGTRLYYTTYRNGNPQIYMVDLKEGEIAPVVKEKGLNLIGGVSADNRKLVMTLSRGENPSIYIKELASGRTLQLTDKYGVDGSPSFSPDGKFVTFVSNRSGNPQVYIMNLETKETRRLTKFNWADTPQWSPNGDWIAFAGRQAADHPIDIFLVDITGGQLRQLTADSGSNEDPWWSPDGRFIAFTTNRSGIRQIYVMDADGSAQHLIANIKGNSFTPSWSD